MGPYIRSPVGPSLAKFPPMAQTSSYATDYCVYRLETCLCGQA